MVGSLVKLLLQVFSSWIKQWNKFENRSIFDAVKANKKSVPVFWAILYTCSCCMRDNYSAGYCGTLGLYISTHANFVFFVIENSLRFSWLKKAYFSSLSLSWCVSQVFFAFNLSKCYCTVRIGLYEHLVSCWCRDDDCGLRDFGDGPNFRV